MQLGTSLGMNMRFREKQSIVMVLQKLKSDPDLFAQSQKAPRGYLTSKSLETSGPHSFSQEEPLQKKWLIKQGNKAQTAICNFAVYLMSTQHPHNPDHTDWIKQTLPLCKKHHEDV